MDDRCICFEKCIHFRAHVIAITYRSNYHMTCNWQPMRFNLAVLAFENASCFFLTSLEGKIIIKPMLETSYMDHPRDD
jgi:hypothetical protein